MFFGKKDQRDFELDFNSILCVGSMGSGKTVKAVTIVRRFCEEDKNNVARILDLQKGADDFHLHKSGPNMHILPVPENSVAAAIEEIAALYRELIERKAGNGGNGKRLLVFEEAHRLYEAIANMRDAVDRVALSRLTEILDNGAEYGIGVMMIMQTIGYTPKEFLNRFKIKVISRVNEGEKSANPDFYTEWECHNKRDSYLPARHRTLVNNEEVAIFIPQKYREPRLKLTDRIRNGIKELLKVG